MTREGETSLERALSQQLAEAAAELRVRRQAVLAEVLGRLRERVEVMDWATTRYPHYGHLASSPEQQLPPQLERHFVDHAAEIVSILLENALVGGAGAQVDELAAAEPEVVHPPATPESLGESS